MELVEVAARLLAEQGPEALTARRVAAQAGCSTMAIYTHFGGMSGLVRDVVREGFSRLRSNFCQLPTSGDPVTHLVGLARAYRYSALSHPHLFRIMFAGASRDLLYSISSEDRQFGQATLETVIECTRRCMAVGRFMAGDAELVGRQIWSATHGLAVLEMEGYLRDPSDMDRCFDAQMTCLMHGLGDELAAARRSVALSAERFRAAITDPAARAMPTSV